MTRMLQVPRSRGAVSGLLLVLLGLWGALIPLVGPYFHYAYTPDSAWTLTAGRGLAGDRARGRHVPRRDHPAGQRIAAVGHVRRGARGGRGRVVRAWHGDHPALARGQHAGPGLPGGHDHNPPAA